MEINGIQMFGNYSQAQIKKILEQHEANAKKPDVNQVKPNNQCNNESNMEDIEIIDFDDDLNEILAQDDPDKFDSTKDVDELINDIDMYKLSDASFDRAHDLLTLIAKDPEAAKELLGKDYYKVTDSIEEYQANPGRESSLRSTLSNAARGHEEELDSLTGELKKDSTVNPEFNVDELINNIDMYKLSDSRFDRAHDLLTLIAKDPETAKEILGKDYYVVTDNIQKYKANPDSINESQLRSKLASSARGYEDQLDNALALSKDKAVDAADNNSVPVANNQQVDVNENISTPVVNNQPITNKLMNDLQINSDSPTAQPVAEMLNKLALEPENVKETIGAKYGELRVTISNYLKNSSPENMSVLKNLILDIADKFDYYSLLNSMGVDESEITQSPVEETISEPAVETKQTPPPVAEIPVESGVEDVPAQSPVEVTQPKSTVETEQALPIVEDTSTPAILFAEEMKEKLTDMSKEGVTIEEVRELMSSMVNADGASNLIADITPEIVQAHLQEMFMDGEITLDAVKTFLETVMINE